MKVVQIGYGRWGEILAKAIDSDTNLDLVGIHTRTPIDNARYHGNLDEFLNNSAIKGVVIATPLANRHIIIKQCLDSGKHILTEKPLAENLSLAKSLLKMAQDRNLILYTNYTHSHSKLVCALKDTILAQNINSIKIKMIESHQIYDNENVDTLIFSHILSILFNLCPSELNSVSKNSIAVHNKYHIISRTPALYLEASILSAKQQRVIEVQTNNETIYVDFGNDGFISLCRNGLTMPRKMMNQSSNLKHVFNAFKAACQFGAYDNSAQALAVQQALDRL